MNKPLNPTGKKHRFGKAWMHEHVTDPFVQEAKRQGYRSRAAFKLTQIGERDKLFRPGGRAVDLGAAPGSWSQVLAQRMGTKATIVAIDLLPMDPVRGVTVLQGDFAADAGLAAVEAALGGRPVDLVVSDMAPNLSGIDSADQARAVHLAELALEFAAKWLQPGGDFAVKAFQGEGFDAFVAAVREQFDKAYVRKPDASRDRSREVFVVGKGFRGHE
ncbi:MAG TPA: SAM-dependent methyltransferase [Casimicrobiaceae bacterium]